MAVRQLKDQLKPRSNSPPEPLQILIISDVFAPIIGGAGVVPAALASCLPENVSVLTQEFKDALPPDCDWKAFDRRFPFRTYRVRSLFTNVSLRLPPKLRGPLQFAFNYLCVRPRVAFQVLRIVAERRVKVVCINTIGAGHWMPTLFKRLKPSLKFIFYQHGEEMGDGKVATRFGRSMLNSLADPDGTIAVSSYTARLAIANGVSPAKISVINNGVDLMRFSPGPKDVALQALHGLSENRTLLCLARLDERKGQDMLIQAMPHILAAVPQTILLLVGSGDDESRLRNLVESLHLQDRVVFAGAVSDEQVLLYYRTADVYVMPNRTTDHGDTEGFGLVFLEAGACGKPVVGGRAGGVPDAIIEGETGYLVDGRSSPSIAEACIRLLANPGLAAQMGQAGLQHARRNDWTLQAAKFLKVCEAVAQNRPQPESQEARSTEP